MTKEEKEEREEQKEGEEGKDKGVQLRDQEGKKVVWIFDQLANFSVYVSQDRITLMIDGQKTINTPISTKFMPKSKSFVHIGRCMKPNLHIIVKVRLPVFSKVGTFNDNKLNPDVLARYFKIKSYVN